MHHLSLKTPPEFELRHLRSGAGGLEIGSYRQEQHHHDHTGRQSTMLNGAGGLAGQPKRPG